MHLTPSAPLVLRPARSLPTFAARCLLLAGTVLVSLPAGRALCAPVQGGSVERVIDLAMPGGDRQRILFVTPASPRATIVMLPGGTGDLGIRRDGELRHGANFVVRTRDLWVERGYAVLIPDAIDDLNLRPLRASPAYGALVGRLIAIAFRLTGRPVILLGTSQGTIAATNGASQALDGGPLAGLVLTETVSLPGQRSTATVFDAHPGRVRVPTLVVANQRDRCDVAPPGEVGRIAAAFTHSSAVTVVTVDGGHGGFDHPCGSLSPHGYEGIAVQVVDDIGGWIARLPALRGSRAGARRLPDAPASD